MTRKQTILLYLHSTAPTQASWIVKGEDNITYDAIFHGNLSTLTQSKNQELIVIIPGEDILLTQAKLPKLSRHRLNQALPFAIEDQLIDDITQLHFAIGAYQVDNVWPVAVITKENIIRLQELFNSFNLFPESIIPAPLSLPLIENHWSIYVLDKKCMVRMGLFSGFTCEIDNLAVYLQSKKESIAIDIYSSFEFHVTSKQNIQFHKMSEKELLEGFFQAYKTQPMINLLQGPFSTTHELAQAKRIRQYASYIFLAAISIGFFNLIFSYFILHHRSSTIENQIEAIYKRNFPTATSFIAPKERMQEKLKKLSNEIEGKSFLTVLGHTTYAFSRSNGIQVQDLDYRDNRLNLQVSCSSFDTLDNFVRLLEQEHLTVKQQTADMIEGRVNASLQIST